MRTVGPARQMVLYILSELIDFLTPKKGINLSRPLRPPEGGESLKPRCSVFSDVEEARRRNEQLSYYFKATCGFRWTPRRVRYLRIHPCPVEVRRPAECGPPFVKR